MKKILKLTTYITGMAFGVALFVGCDEDEQYAEIPNELYIVNVVTPGTVNFTNSAAARENIQTGTARVYLNQIVATDVEVTFTISGTAASGSDFTAPSSTTVVIPAGSRFGQIDFPILDDTVKETNETVVITLNSATGDFQVGLGHAKAYTVFTYTIQDND